MHTATCHRTTARMTPATIMPPRVDCVHGGLGIRTVESDDCVYGTTGSLFDSTQLGLSASLSLSRPHAANALHVIVLDWLVGCIRGMRVC